jgi:hypothetical protein
MLNIFQFNLENLYAWTAAYTILEPLSYYLIPAFSKSKTVQEYYDSTKTPVFVVVFGDYIYSTFLLLLSMIVNPILWGNTDTINILGWIQRFFTFVVVQWIGDISFYNIVRNLEFHTKYIDFFTRYGKEVSLGAPIGDSIYGFIWFTLTQFIATSVPNVVKTILISLFLFGTLIMTY